MKFELDGKIIQSGQTIDELSLIMKDYEFKQTLPEYGEEIILHGDIDVVETEHKIAVHMYFLKQNNKLNNMVIHPLPIDFHKMQTYLEKQFGIPNKVDLFNNKQWEVEDGEIVHSIIDRFGEEEMILFRF